MFSSSFFSLHFFRHAALASLLGAWASSPAAPVSEKEIRQGFREGRVITKTRVGFGAAAQNLEGSGPRVRSLKRFKHLAGMRVLESESGEEVGSLIRRLRASGAYEFVEPDYIRGEALVPNDPRFSDGSQWSLQNDGRSGGIVGADLRATSGWNTRTDASGVIVAVIDSGLRLTHEDLQANLWVNPGEIPGNGVDDDGNGYVDDVHGINALVARSGNPADNRGHGTLVAGIIGAVGNNGRGISGLAWRVQLMALKFLGDDGYGSTSDAIECIDYAIAHGAHIINASYGAINTQSFSYAERDAIRRARAAGIIFVAAAGNDSLNLDVSNQSPSTLLVDNIVTVGASGRRDEAEVFSNYGSGMVEIFAPGASILSTAYTANNAYASASGTSFAAPHVSGALALLKAQYPGDGYRALINRLLRGSAGQSAVAHSLRFKSQTGGRLSLPAVLTATDTRPLNDDFAQAIMLSGANVRARAGNTHGTLQGGEPSLGITGGASLWWRWTSPADGVVNLDSGESVGLSGAALLARVGVFTGSELAGLVAAPSTAVSPSRLSFVAQAGTTYQIVVDSQNGTSGLLAFSLGTEPANNAFATPTLLSGRSQAVTATNLNADRESDEPTILAQPGSHSVWFSWTAPASGRFQFSVYSADFEPLLAIYTGSQISQLNLVGASRAIRPEDGVDGALVTIAATAGTTYRIAVDTASGQAGSFTLSLVDSLWQFGTGGAVTSSPAVAIDGTIYIGSTDRNLYALQPDGTEKWRFRVDGIIDMSSPAVAADGTVYFGANDRYIRALNPDGTLKWRYATESTVVSSIAIAHDGNLYTKDSSGTLLALSPAGELRWQRTLGGETYASPVIGADGTIYVGANDTGGFRAYTPGGTLLWQFTTSGDIYSSAAIDDAGRLYFATLNGNVYALGSQGTLLWQRSLGTGISSSPTLGDDGTLYLGSYDRKLHALNTTDGTIRWEYALPDEVRGSSPVVAADGSVLIGCYDGLVHHVEPNGQLRRTYATGYRIRSSPLIHANRLLVGSNDGKLYALEPGVGVSTGSPWPMFQHDARRQGRFETSNVLSPTVSVAASAPSAQLGATITLQAFATGGSLAYQWRRDGRLIAGAITATLALPDLQPADAGLYSVIVSNPVGQTESQPLLVAPDLGSTRMAGTINQVLENVLHPNGNRYDQFLLTGAGASVTAVPGRAVRLSFVDLNDDIVQVEFSGPGTLSLVLDEATGPGAPVQYHQPGVLYMKGHARLYFSGATAGSNLGIFSVGTYTAVNQTLFPAGVEYDGVADLALIAIASTTGNFAGLRAGNLSLFADHGLTGLHAPGVAFSGPVILHDVTAFADAQPGLLTGAIATGEIWITGGNLAQDNDRAVQIGPVERIVMRPGTDSHQRLQPAQTNRARFERDGVDVTATVVANPGP